MTKIRLFGVIGVVVGCSVSVAAQWPKHQTPNVPRDAQGNVRAEAPPPRTPDGKPDLSGMWTRADRAGGRGGRGGRGGPEGRGAQEGRGGQEGRGEPSAAVLPSPIEPATQPFPPDPNSPPIATFFELGTNIPGGLPFTPWAADLRKERMATNSKENPDANCMPMGITQFHMQPQPRMIVQTPKMIMILYEANYGLRYIYTDGRKLPPQGEPQPWWYGYSVGHWEGDTLVVETNNSRGAESGVFDGWLDVNGSPYSDQAIFTERFRRPIFGKLEIDVTVDDAKSYTKPFTVRINQRIIVDEEPIEFICNENQQFRRRVKID
jgi:hypothetical protein